MDDRIKLKKGLQKRLIDKVKKRKSLSWNKLGKLLNVSPSYLRSAGATLFFDALFCGLKND